MKYRKTQVKGKACQGFKSKAIKTARRGGKRTVSTQAKFTPKEPIKPSAMVKKSKTAKNYASDYAQLKKLLRTKGVTDDLDYLSELAHRASIKPHRSDEYSTLTKAFCDGIEVKLGPISKEEVMESKADLLNDLQKEVDGLVI